MKHRQTTPVIRAHARLCGYVVADAIAGDAWSINWLAHHLNVPSDAETRRLFTKAMHSLPRNARHKP